MTQMSVFENLRQLFRGLFAWINMQMSRQTTLLSATAHMSSGLCWSGHWRALSLSLPPPLTHLHTHTHDYIPPLLLLQMCPSQIGQRQASNGPTKKSKPLPRPHYQLARRPS